MHVRDYDRVKFQELLLYLAQRSESDPWFGAIKLQKLVVCAEFRAFRELGQSITGVPIQNLPQGVTAKQMLPAQNELIEHEHAEIVRVPTSAGVQKRLVAKRAPNLSAFSADELQIIEATLAALRGKTASQLSQESHEEPGWLVTSEREAIPYYMALLSRPLPTPEDEAFVRRLEESGALPSRP